MAAGGSHTTIQCGLVRNDVLIWGHFIRSNCRDRPPGRSGCCCKKLPIEVEFFDGPSMTPVPTMAFENGTLNYKSSAIAEQSHYPEDIRPGQDLHQKQLAPQDQQICPGALGGDGQERCRKDGE